MLILFLVSCSVDPEPIQYGSDLCQTCKMGIMEKGFAAEIVTKKGKVYKFDDVGCQLLFLKSGAIKQEDCAHILVIKHGTEQDFVDVKNAIFLTGAKIKSPMNFNLACYHSDDMIPVIYLDSSIRKFNWAELMSTIGK
ncbi:MAG: nitrous oxide reductase accessory protein NosL [Saprospiraceae bacterium]|nr:nitrous oxide reductase accessory protein NosL [Saprospiraceae bacterium]